MKLTTTTQLSLDGVMQSPGGPDEDKRSGFSRGGWAHFDKESEAFINQVFRRADAFLFGRKTYDIFVASWGTMPDPGDNPIALALHTRPKYVVSNTLREPTWANTKVLSGDFASEIRKLRAQSGGELQVHGSGQLIRWLIENRLVDEMNLVICPVIVGQGTRLFPDTGPDSALDLVESKATPTGVTMHRYRLNGHPTYTTPQEIEQAMQWFKQGGDKK